MSFIEVNGLSKSYKVNKVSNEKGLFGKKRVTENIEAIKNLSFSIEKQDIIGYIGPNGAGKSTTIKILSGILQPDSGTCLADGIVPWDNRKDYVKNIGVMFGQRSQLLWDLPAKDSFDMLRRIYDMSKSEYEKSLNLLTEMLELKELLKTPVRQMSLGQRMRCELAATFLHRPKLVFLDEPTIGIDIEIKKKFHNFILEINKTMEVTIFITTHDLDDIQSLCNKLMIINKGEIYYNGTLENLYNNNYIDQKVFVEMSDGCDILLPEGTKIDKEDGNKYVISVGQQNMVGSVISNIAKANNVISIYAEKTELEDIILKIYKGFKGNK
jgi:ABC-2 type transport system ATP-binding protein